MNFETTYYMVEAFTRGAFRTREMDNVLGLNSPKLQIGLWSPPAILRFRQYEGRKLYDCVGSQNATMLVSDKVIATLREMNASGWDTYPVVLEAKDGTEVKGYSGLIVRGGVSPSDRIDALLEQTPHDHRRTRRRALRRVATISWLA